MIVEAVRAVRPARRMVGRHAAGNTLLARAVDDLLARAGLPGEGQGT